MPPSADPGTLNISLTGDAGCLGCLAIVGIPAFVAWRLKRRLFGHSQPGFEAVWLHTPGTGMPAGMTELQAHDRNVSYAELTSHVMTSFAALTKADAEGLQWIATPEMTASLQRRPWRAVVEHGTLISVSSEGGHDRMVAELHGHRAKHPLWWTPWEEQWTFSRFTPIHAKGDVPLCRNCGAPVTDSPDGLCRYCGHPAPGLIDTWRLESRSVVGAPLFQ